MAPRSISLQLTPDQLAETLRWFAVDWLAAASSEHHDDPFGAMIVVLEKENGKGFHFLHRRLEAAIRKTMGGALSLRELHELVSDEEAWPDDAVPSTTALDAVDLGALSDAAHEIWSRSSTRDRIRILIKLLTVGTFTLACACGEWGVDALRRRLNGEIELLEIYTALHASWWLTMLALSGWPRPETIPESMWKAIHGLCEQVDDIASDAEGDGRG